MLVLGSRLAHKLFSHPFSPATMKRRRPDTPMAHTTVVASGTQGFHAVVTAVRQLPVLAALLGRVPLCTAKALLRTCRGLREAVAHNLALVHNFAHVRVETADQLGRANTRFRPRSLCYDYGEGVPRGVLTATLTHLKFGDRYNQSIGAGVLPASLTHLTFGCDYNQPVAAGVLPPSLTHLEFGLYYKQILGAGVLPASLTHLNNWEE